MCHPCSRWVQAVGRGIEAELAPIFGAGRYEWLEVRFGREIPARFKCRLEFAARMADAAVAGEEIAELGRLRELRPGAELNGRAFKLRDLEPDGAIGFGKALVFAVRAEGGGDSRLEECASLRIGDDRRGEEGKNEEKYADYMHFVSYLLELMSLA